MALSGVSPSLSNYLGNKLLEIVSTDAVNSGNDRLYGGKDNDTVIGGGGNDYLEGVEGEDILFGDHGKIEFKNGIIKNELFHVIPLFKKSKEISF